MIYLNPEVRSGLGEDTFWTWFAREFPTASFELPKEFKPEDCVLQYATLGPIDCRPGKSIALLWELYPEMKWAFGTDRWNEKIDRMMACAASSDYRVAATSDVLGHYTLLPRTDVIPIGVDMRLFHPVMTKAEKDLLRQKYGLPPGQILFWCGTSHPMKGFDRLQEYAKKHETHWVIVWKSEAERGISPPGSSVFTKIPQMQLSELMQASDAFVVTSRLRPFFLVEYEAMACGLPYLNLSGFRKEVRSDQDMRQSLRVLGWSRSVVKLAWENYLSAREILW